MTNVSLLNFPTFIIKCQIEDWIMSQMEMIKISNLKDFYRISFKIYKLEKYFAGNLRCKIRCEKDLEESYYQIFHSLKNNIEICEKEKTKIMEKLKDIDSLKRDFKNHMVNCKHEHFTFEKHNLNIIRKMTKKLFKNEMERTRHFKNVFKMLHKAWTNLQTSYSRGLQYIEYPDPKIILLPKFLLSEPANFIQEEIKYNLKKEKYIEKIKTSFNRK